MKLIDQPARDRITGAVPKGLDETLFVEAGAGSGKTWSLVERVCRLVRTGRAQLDQAAAITFTEKAAAELRDRIRTRLVDLSTSDELDESERGRVRAAIDQVDTSAIGTLHSFAQRILVLHAIEAGLPPHVEVLDEVSSQVAFEQQWIRLRASLLDDPEHAEMLVLAFASGIRLDDIRALVRELEANWDLAADPERIASNVAPLPTVNSAGLLDLLDVVLARRDACTSASDLLLKHLDTTVAPFREELATAPDPAAELEAIRTTRKLTSRNGQKGSWGDLKPTILEELAAIDSRRAAIVKEVSDVLMARLLVIGRDAVLAAAEERRRSGQLVFHDLLVLARDLLRGPNGVRVRKSLRERWVALLLDEFQDTDPIQLDIAVLLASPDAEAGNRDWAEFDTDAGRLFFVGDPKQSIYRFRRADINLFLRAADRFGGAGGESLVTNFRSTPSVLEFVNHVFGQLIQPRTGSQPGYRALAPAPDATDASVGPGAAVVGMGILPKELNADAVREVEATAVAETIRHAHGEWLVRGGQGWRPTTLGDITILVPSRTSLPILERTLDHHGIRYRAESSSLVYGTREVRDLLMVMRAVADPSDALALVAALRSTVLGCGDDDLVVFKRVHRGVFNIHAPLPEDVPPDDPVADGIRFLSALREVAAWSTPSQLLDRICRERHLFELGHATGHPQDLWRRLRFVIDHARAWHESEGGSLQEFVAWARLQASESARVAETVLPETDDESVRIMTIHAAKGLEFPITIVSGMSTAPGGRRNRVEVVWPPDKPAGVRFGSDLESPEFLAFTPVDEQMDDDERLRLLYVACTRARDHLVVSVHRKERGGKPTSAELLAGALPEEVTAIAPPEDTRWRLSVSIADDGASVVPDLATWRDERDGALTTASQATTVAATDVQLLLARELDAGDEKDPLDLDLPAWQKGRYGTAIGRAVHAVLQTINLSDGAGLDETVAAQAAAEGVEGHEDDIRRLAAAALEAPSVAAAAARPASDRWRETYVAARIGHTVIEGYIDLLYRTDQGIVIVDYKTASRADDLDGRVEHYRPQGAAYALAVEAATGLPVADVRFVFLTPEGVEERSMNDLPVAMAQVREGLLASARPAES